MLPAGSYGFLLVANLLEKPAGDSRCRQYKQRLNENERPNPVAQHFGQDGRNGL